MTSPRPIVSSNIDVERLIGHCTPMTRIRAFEEAGLEAQKRGLVPGAIHLSIAHEVVQVAGFGAEIAATIAEEMFHRLEAPVRRLGAPRVPIGYAPSLEGAVKILAERDLAPAIRALAHAGQAISKAQGG